MVRVRVRVRDRVRVSVRVRVRVGLGLGLCLMHLTYFIVFSSLFNFKSLFFLAFF